MFFLPPNRGCHLNVNSGRTQVVTGVDSKSIVIFTRRFESCRPRSFLFLPHLRNHRLRPRDRLGTSAVDMCVICHVQPTQLIGCVSLRSCVATPPPHFVCHLVCHCVCHFVCHFVCQVTQQFLDVCQPRLGMGFANWRNTPVTAFDPAVVEPEKVLSEKAFVSCTGWCDPARCVPSAASGVPTPIPRVARAPAAVC